MFLDLFILLQHYTVALSTVLNAFTSRFHQLAYQRIEEAENLLGLNFADGAFYLAGYAIECALKAAVCHTLDQDDFYVPDRSNKSARYVQDKVLKEFKTHNYNDLLILSGLSNKLDSEVVVNPVMAGAWITLNEMRWSEQARYQCSIWPSNDVARFLEAVKTIVLWISKYW